MKRVYLILWFLLLMVITACSHTASSSAGQEDIYFDNNNLIITATPFQPDWGAEKPVNDETGTSDRESSDSSVITLGIGSTVPQFFIAEMQLGEAVSLSDEMENADLFFVQSDNCENPSTFVYALAASFPTLLDNVSTDVLESAWKNPVADFNDLPILMTEETYQVFSKLWGTPSENAVAIVEESDLVTNAWDTDQFAIIPFHDLDGRWKVIRIDGNSILNSSLSNDNYPLSISFCLIGMEEVYEFPMGEEYSINVPSTNRDTTKMTSVIMTGVTALVRATASRMETKGITYPGEKIRDLLLDADFTHISNEVAFATDCPYPDPYQTDLQFCSSPSYEELLSYLDIDIIELTGNHIQDWGRDPFVETLQLYKDNGYLYFGGGMNLSEAKQPLLIEHNGNKLAFVGCNAVGPSGAFATSALSGNAYCDDYEWIEQSVKDLTAQGYLVIVTLQHYEFYSLQKTSPQLQDFNPLAVAGAVVVSGSQAHYPNPFGFEGTHFIHYGLGNLFFDQMDPYIADGIQREFVDKHYFYNGNYISTEVFTLHLEDFAQPRMMTDTERREFLQETFSASGWK